MARFEAAVHDFIAFHPSGGSSPDALYELGLLYALGRDVRTDLVQAHKWLNVAALRGNLAARRMRAEISEDMSRSDLMKAQRLAREWLTTH
ncbi:MAG: hypothetical protein ABL912_13725 [Novosphingobium sp.]|nr:sel1 repeat family protein [Hyphomicrobiaceae bacterium]